MKDFKKAIMPITVFLLGALSVLFGVLSIENSTVSLITERKGVWNFLLIFSICLLSSLVYLLEYYQKEKTRKIFILLLGTLFFVFLFIYFYGRLKQSVNLSSVEDLRAFIAAKGQSAVWLFILVQFAQVTLIPIPSTITTGAGYALFGLWKGTIYAFIGSMLGSVLAFAIGKVLGYRAAAWIVGKETLDGWLKKLQGKDKLLLTFMFIMPFFPDDILCIIAGLSSMSTQFFVTMMLPVRFISIFTTCLTLSGKLIPFRSWGIAVWGVLFAVVIAVTLILWKRGTKLQEVFLRWFQKRKKDDK